MRCFCLIYLAWFELQAVLWFNIGNVEAIIGGKPAAIDQFKYMVSVQADGKHICGGAIVSNVHIITAAHCVIGKDNKFINNKYTIVARVTNLVSNEVPTIEESVETIFAPKNYVCDFRKKPDFENNFYPEVADIAILKLRKELPLNDYLRAVNIPHRNGKHNLPKYTKSEATLTGFGKDIDLHRGIKRDRNSTVTTSNENIRLNFIEVTVQHKNECKNMVPFFGHDNYVIALAKKHKYLDRKGACTGDDGSPLVYDNILIGVLSQYWYDCNETFFGSIYTRVSYYLQYIKDVMKGMPWKNSRFAMYKETISTTGQILWNLEETNGS